MKKLFLCLLLLGGAYAVVSAKDTYAHDASVLPEAARNVIGKNFKSKVSVVKIDKDFGRVSEYDVTLSDGTEITFDRQGNWKDVETNVNSSVPSAFYPSAIASYVKKNHSGTRVVGVEKERRGYDVTLSNGIELKFDSQGNFLRYDD